MGIPLSEALGKAGNVFVHVVKHPKLVRRLISHLYKGYLLESGWINSYLHKIPVDKSGDPLPWFTFPAIDFLEGRLGPELNVFEYGGGQSTLYFAKRTGKVTTVEHHAGWHERLAKMVPENCRLIFCELEPDGAYSKAAVETGGGYDVIVVDGRDRVNCARNAADAVADKGVIIIDDFERERYHPAADELAKRGFRRLDFWGIKPGLFDRVNTALFYRDDNVFGL